MGAMMAATTEVRASTEGEEGTEKGSMRATMMVEGVGTGAQVSNFWRKVCVGHFLK